MRLRETVRSLNELLARKNETINALNFSNQSLEEEIASLGLEQGAFEDLQALMVTLRADLEDRDTRIAELQLQWEALQTQHMVQKLMPRPMEMALALDLPV